MRQALGLLGLGAVALVVQGAATAWVPSHLVPDLRFLVIVGVGLSAPVAPGLLIVAAIGYATDLLSGALLGQHALLAVLAFAASRTVNRHINLRGDLPRAIFVLLLTIAHAVGLALLAWLFEQTPLAGAGLAGPLLVHAVLNGVLAPPAISLVDRAAHVLSDEEAVRRPVRLVARGRS